MNVKNNNKEFFKKIADSQGKYYGSLFKKYSYSPLAVGSENEINKKIRFLKLSKCFLDDNDFSLHEIGYGLGHYYEFLKLNYPQKKIRYSGSEVCEEFADYCREKYPECDFQLRNLANKKFKEKYDYIVFGGTFYHIEDNNKNNWEKFIEAMLKNGFQNARKGISFNMITAYCDYFKKGLFYCDPNYAIKFIIKNLSRFFSIDHSYPLYEFTICVYKESYIKSLFPENKLKKYFKK